MDTGEFQRLQELFEAARDLPADQRDSLIDEATADSPKLRSAVLRLLRHYDAETQALEQAPAEAPPRSSEIGGLEPGAFIGQFQIVRTIGSGGMGIVYLAEQREPERQVAVKVIRPELATPELLKRFRFEALVLAKLQHPGIAHVYESGVETVETDRGRFELPYIAMEFVDGATLTERCKRRNTREILELFVEVCDAVHHAHQSGFIHRDLKPGNILIDAAGRPKILDFGVARATTPDLNAVTLQTHVGQIVGTLPYMSPEQIGGQPEEIDHRCDVYALGVVLYELLAGRLPLDMKGKNLAEASRMITEEEPTQLSMFDSSFRGDIATMVAKALEKDLDRRYGSVAEFGDDLRRHLSDEPIAAHPASSWYRLKKFSRRNRGLVTGLTAAMLVLVIGSIVSATLAVRNGRLASDAQESEVKAERTTYRTSLIAGLAALENLDFIRLQEHLELAPEQLRGWEWHHLHSLTLDRITVDTSCRSTPVFDADGVALVATQHEGELRVIELSSGVTRWIVEAPQRYSALQISEDLSRLVAYDLEHSRLDLWELPTGERQKSIAVTTTARGSGAPAFVCNRDASLIAVDYGSVVDTDEGTVLRTLENRATAIRGDVVLEWNAEANWNADARAWARLVNARTGEVLGTHELPPGSASGLTWSRNGERIAFRSLFGETRILDAQLEVIHQFKSRVESPGLPLAFVRDDLLLEALPGQGVRAVDVRTGRTVWTLPTGGPVARLVPSATDQIATASVFDTGAKAALLSLPEVSAVLRGHDSYVYSVAFSPDGKYLASGSWDETVRLWDLSSQREFSRIRMAEEDKKRANRIVRGLGFGTDPSRVLVVRSWANVFRWDWATGAFDEVADGQDDDGFLVRADFLRLAHGGSKIWALGLGEASASSFDSPQWAEGLWDGEVVLRRFAEDPTSPGAIESSFRSHQNRVHAIAYHPQERWLAAGGHDGTIKIWNLDSTEEPIAELVDHQREVFSLAFSPDGSRLASGGRDGLLRIWDVESMQLVAAMRGHASYIHSLAFSPDGSCIATGSGDTTVRIWDSMPRSMRRETHREDLTLRQEVRPLIEDSLETRGPAATAEWIRTELPTTQRHAALRELQERLR